MTVYELRTYDLQVGTLGQVLQLYKDLGWPALESGGFDDNLVGYFTSDVGELNQLVHLWKFDDDETRRAFWKRLFRDEAFMTFAHKLRPFIHRQRNQLLLNAPWGPCP
ncbi:MAG: NIPSNAP family protein [Pseudomonadota bacterium]